MLFNLIFLSGDLGAAMKEIVMALCKMVQFILAAWNETGVCTAYHTCAWTFFFVSFFARSFALLSLAGYLCVTRCPNCAVPALISMQAAHQALCDPGHPAAHQHNCQDRLLLPHGRPRPGLAVPDYLPDEAHQMQ
jgi:hypothetical protein